MTPTVLHGDCLEILPTLEAESFHACVCDPPYHLTSIVKRFGGENAAPAQFGKDGAFARASRGFMGKQWDGGDVALRPETWAEVLRVLRPGAHLLAFGGTRTFHRMAVAIEDSGFEIRDTVMWLYGSGFPKSHNQPGGWGTALKPAWEPIVVARKALAGTVAANMSAHGTGAINIDGCRVPMGADYDPALMQRQQSNRQTWEGGSAAGFAADHIQSTYNSKGRWPANVMHDGSAEVEDAFPEAPGQQGYVGPEQGGRPSLNVYGDFGARPPSHPRGDTGSASRFFYRSAPDTLCGLCGLRCGAARDRNVACNAHNAESNSPTEDTQKNGFARCDAVVPQQQDREDRSSHLSLDVECAESSSEGCRPREISTAQQNVQEWPLGKIVQNVKSAAALCDTCATGIAQSLARVRLSHDPLSLPIVGCIDEPRWQILLQSLALYVAGRENTDTILTIPNLSQWFGSVFYAIAESTRQGNDANSASSAQGPTRFRYSSKADASDRAGSKHPTVKPLDLMRYLVRLVTPSGGHVLDCFAGSGSTGEAAMLEGFHATLIEREAEYVTDIRRRLGRASGADTPLFASAP